MLSAFTPVAAAFASQDAYIPLGGGQQGAVLAGHVGRDGGQVAAGLQPHIARSLDGGAHVPHIALLEVVAGIADVVLLLGNLDGAEVQVTAGDDGGLAVLAAVDDLGRNQIGVAARRGQQDAAGAGDIETRYAVEIGPAEVAQARLLDVAAGGADDVDVASGIEQERGVGIERAADVVDVGPGVERDGIARDAAAEVA
ncbi:hypothetical protein FQZ97_615490 [compost metagenome]